MAGLAVLGLVPVLTKVGQPGDAARGVGEAPWPGCLAQDGSSSPRWGVPEVSPPPSSSPHHSWTHSAAATQVGATMLQPGPEGGRAGGTRG